MPVWRCASFKVYLEGRKRYYTFLLWGCSRYRANERFQHDRAIAFHSATLSSILDNPQYITKMSEKSQRHRRGGGG